MQNTYSLELHSEKINNQKTKQAFKEVLSSYWSENYRSATVVLWTVVVYDMLLKLEDSATTFEDQRSQNQLETIRNHMISKPTDASWEISLARHFKDTHKMFTEKEFEDIQRIQKDRHMCAHPSLTNSIVEGDIELYYPTQEQTRHHIRTALDTILTRPSLASDSIFHLILNDLSSSKDMFATNQKLEIYLTSRYLKRSTKEQRQIIIKKLWKVVFSCEDEQANKNRDINTRALTIMLEASKNDAIENIKLNHEHFNRIKNNTIILKNLSLLILENMYIWDFLTEDNKTILKSSIANNYGHNPILWIIEDSIKEKIQDIKENPSKYKSDDGTYGLHNNETAPFIIHPDTLKYIIRHDTSETPIHELVIWAYENAESFATARQIMSEYIHPNLQHITIEQLNSMAGAHGKNRQLIAILPQHEIELRDIIKEKFKDSFNTEEYTEFSEQIGLIPTTLPF